MCRGDSLERSSHLRERPQTAPRDAEGDQHRSDNAACQADPQQDTKFLHELLIRRPVLSDLDRVELTAGFFSQRNQ